MITSGILFIIYFVVWGLTYPLRALPDASLPIAVATAITSINGYITAINNIFPVSNLLIIMGLLISIELGIFTYKVIMWVIKRFPTQS